MDFKDTLDNDAWLLENENKIKDILPETFTHMRNLNPVKIGYQLKVLGLDWRSDKDFGSMMVQLEKRKILVREDHLIKGSLKRR